MLRFDDFTGGLYLPEESAPTTPQPSFAIPPNALRQADNIDYMPTGAVRGRRGSRLASSGAGALQIIRRFVLRDRPGKIVSRRDGNPSYDFDAGFGSAVWQNPFGVDAQEGRFASNARVSLGANDISHYLVRRGPGAFTPVPIDATITGLRVILPIRREDKLASAVQDYKVHLVNASGVIVGQTSDGQANHTPFTADHDHPQRLEYGDSSNTWGIGLNPGIVNDPDFGVGFSVENTSGILGAQLLVAGFQIEIYYTVPDTGITVIGHTDGALITYETLDVTNGNRTAITGGSLIQPPGRPNAVIWPQKQRLYFFDGANAPQVYDGSTMFPLVGAPDSQLDPPRGPYVVLHLSRLFATQPGEGQYSVYASEPDRDDQWLPDAHLSVNDEAGGHVTGLASFGQLLIMLKDTSLFSFFGSIVYGGQLTLYSRVGCVAPDTVQVTPEGVIYLGRDGLKMTDGTGAVDISAPIRSLFSGRLEETVYTNAVGRWFPRRQQYWLKLDPTTEPGYILHRIASPNGTTLAWSRVPVLPMNCGEVFNLATDEGELYLGDLEGNVWERDIGLDDDGDAISSIVRTQDRILDAKTRRLGRAFAVRPLYRGATPFVLGLNYDSALTDVLTFAPGSTLADVDYQNPRTFVANQTHFGRFLAIAAASNESANFELHRVDVDVRMRGLRRWP